MLCTRKVAVLAFGVTAAGSAACDTRPTTTGSQGAGGAAAPCPACECTCDCPAGDATGAKSTVTTTSPTPRTSADVREETEALTHALSRKIVKKDASCVADFARLTEIAPAAAGRMAYVHGQCMLVAGKCDEGASILRKELTETMQTTPEMIERSVEQVVLMSCTARLDERGEMLRAVNKLQEGAYQGNIGIRACNNAIDTVAKLKSRVRPKDDDDHVVLTLPDTFAMMAASCLARAGDCPGAWSSFREHHNGERLAGVTDPTTRATVVREMFEGVAQKCKGKI